MIKARLVKIVAAGCIAALCVCALASCTGGSNKAASGTAFTVNGTAISEDVVTTAIESARAQAGLDDADQWGTWLVANNTTAAEIREEIIHSLMERELVKAGAAEVGVTVESSEIDTYVEQMKANFASEEAWQTALKQAGYTEEEYRATIENSLLRQDMLEKFESEAEVTNDALLELANTYAAYYNGTKQSSHILFDADDAATAQSVLDRIKSGELDFAQAAKEYSLDGSAENGGDVGWDASTTFVDEYQTALDGLAVGEVSGLVTSQYGIHIIKCTDMFNVEGSVTDMNQVPVYFRDIIADRAKYQAGVNAYNEWLEGLEESATIEINEIPANVPYNIDLTKYQKAAEEAAAAAASASAESASAEAASSDANASADAADSGEAASSDAAASADAAASGEASSSSAAQ